MIPAATIAIIAVSFLNGLYQDAYIEQTQCRYFRAESDRCGAPGRPEDYPNDGPGFHDKPKNYNNESDEDYYFVGAK